MTAFPDHTLLPLPGDVTFGGDCLEIDGEFRIALTGADELRLSSRCGALRAGCPTVDGLESFRGVGGDR